MELWFVADNGGQRGPLLREDLVALIRSGQVSQGALVWRHGFKEWQPLAAHFDFPGPAATDRREPPPGPPSWAAPTRGKALAQGKPGRRTTNREAVAGVLWLLAAAVAGAIGYTLRKQTLQAGNPLVNTAIWCSGVLVPTACAAMSIWKLWKGCNRAVVPRSVGVGLLKVGLVVSAVFLALFSGFLLRQVPTIYRIAVARQAFDKYKVDVRLVSREILVHGDIGPGLASKLRDALDANAGFRTIVITSPGGLIDEGLAAARVIEAHPGLAVVARKQCNSACLLLLMAATKRFADWDMSLGFHATSSITRANSSLEIFANTTEARVADAYLLSHGVPPAIVARANRIGPNKLESVPSINLASRGVLTGLLDGSALVSTNDARWMAVEKAFASHEETKPLSGVLGALRVGSPALVRKYAKPLYGRFEARDGPGVRADMHAIVGVATRAALPSASPDTMFAYLEAQTRTIAYLRQTERWRKCAAYADGQGLANASTVPQAMVNGELLALTQVIESAARAHWQPVPIPSWADARTSQIYSATADKLVQLKLDPSHVSTDAKTKCVATTVLLQELDKLGPLGATMVWRNIIQSEKSNELPQRQPPPQTPRSNAESGGPLPVGGARHGDITATLTAVQMGAIADKVRECWKRHGGAAHIHQMSVQLIVTYDQQGVARIARVGPVDIGRMADPAFRAFAERAQRAVLSPRCSDLPIPPADLGKVGTLTFSFVPN